jgi:hypothetical protein
MKAGIASASVAVVVAAEGVDCSISVYMQGSRQMDSLVGKVEEAVVEVVVEVGQVVRNNLFLGIVEDMVMLVEP